MPKPMGFDEKLPNAYDKYAAKNNVIDVILCIKSKLTDVMTGEVAEGTFWPLDTIDGERATAEGNKYWSVNVHPDPTQNYADQYGTRKSKVACLVLKLGQYNMTYSEFREGIECLPWVFTGQRWDRLRSLGNATSREMAVICLGREKFQENVQIDPMMDESKRVLARMLANPTFKTKIQSEVARGQQNFAKFMKPDSREDQFAAVTGQKANTATSVPPIGGGGGFAGHHQFPPAQDGMSAAFGNPQIAQQRPASPRTDMDSIFGSAGGGGGGGGASVDPLAGFDDGNFASTKNAAIDADFVERKTPATDNPEDIVNDFMGGM